MTNLISIYPNIHNNFTVKVKSSDIEKKYQSCPCCNKKEIKKLFIFGDTSNKNISLSICKICTHLFYDNILSQNKIKNYYKNKFSTSLIKKIRVNYKYYKLLKKFKKNYRNKNILDFGCGSGGMLNGLKLKGYKRLYGVELSNDRRKVAKFIIKNTFSDINKIKNVKFDIIFLNHVLEHIVNIQNTIKILKSKLNRDGIIIINVPNTEYENIISQIVFHPHLHKFTFKSMNELAKSTKLTMNINNSYRSDEISVSLSKNINKSKVKSKNTKLTFFLKRFENLILSSLSNENKIFTHTKSGLIQHLSNYERRKTYFEVKGLFKFFYFILFKLYKINFKLFSRIILQILRISTNKKINNFGYYAVRTISLDRSKIFPISIKLKNKDNTILMK